MLEGMPSPTPMGGLRGGTKAPTPTEALTLVMSPNADLFLGPPWGEDGDLLA